MVTRYGRLSASTFTAPFWAKNPNVQTIWPKFFAPSPNIQIIPERVATPDGDFVDLAWYLPKQPKAIALVFHGLEGSINSHYVRQLFAYLYQHNIGAVLMHFRGCSGEMNLTHRAYHSGDTGDAGYIIKRIKQRYPTRSLFCVGYSLGGNVLLKLLAEQHNEYQAYVNAAIAVSAPIDLHASAEAINFGFSKYYQAHLLRSMKANILNKIKHIDMTRFIDVSAKDIATFSSFREFDEHITAKLHGFEGADDYYTQCSAITTLRDINTPTLILHARDDPFMDARVIPQAEELSPSVAYEISEFGGHVGFIQGNPVKPNLWLPNRITKFISEHL